MYHESFFNIIAHKNYRFSFMKMKKLLIIIIIIIRY